MMATQQDSVGYRFQDASQQRCNNSAQLQHIPQTLLENSLLLSKFPGFQQVWSPQALDTESQPPNPVAPNLASSTFLPGTSSLHIFSKVSLPAKALNACMLLCWRVQPCTAEMLTCTAGLRGEGRSEWVVGCFTREKESVEFRVFPRWPFCEAHPPGFTIKPLLTPLYQ